MKKRVKVTRRNSYRKQELQNQNHEPHIKVQFCAFDLFKNVEDSAYCHLNQKR